METIIFNCSKCSLDFVRGIALVVKRSVKSYSDPRSTFKHIESQIII